MSTFQPKFIPVNDKLNWDWDWLSENPNAIPILEQNLDKIDWALLSWNLNAIPILQQNLDKVNWVLLSTNPNAIHLLEQNIDKIDWVQLSANLNAIHLLFKYDFNKMKESCKEFNKELIEYVYHPIRLIKLTQFYNIDLDEYLELI